MLFGRKINVDFSLIVISIAVLSIAILSAGCGKDDNPGVEGGDFASKESMSDVFTTDGNTTLTLSSDETFDMTGIRFTGRKQFFLNGHTLKLTGVYSVSQEAVLDIKSGEVPDQGLVDLSELEFDLSQAPESTPDGMLPVIEIDNAAKMEEPPEYEYIKVVDFGVLTAVNVIIDFNE